MNRKAVDASEIETRRFHRIKKKKSAKRAGVDYDLGFGTRTALAMFSCIAHVLLVRKFFERIGSLNATPLQFSHESLYPGNKQYFSGDVAVHMPAAATVII